MASYGLVNVLARFKKKKYAIAVVVLVLISSFSVVYGNMVNYDSDNQKSVEEFYTALKGKGGGAPPSVHVPLHA